jgi:6-phosphogluconolactonase
MCGPAATSGPRHIALHSNGMWLYSINETAGGASTTSGTIDLFTVNQTNGTVTPTMTFNVPLPTGYTGLKNGSEIEIAPSGNMLFVSMRLGSSTYRRMGGCWSSGTRTRTRWPCSASIPRPAT